MEIKTLVVGELDTNCYVVSDPVTKEAVVIDPGDDGSFILDYLQAKQLQVKYILNTHGHFDHMQAVDQLRAVTGAPFAIHVDDHELLLEPQRTAKGMFIDANPCKPSDFQLHNGDIIRFGNYQLKVIYTPGHSKGGCCFYKPEEKVCFSGDTLFRRGVGRTDLYGGDFATLQHSIKKRMAEVDDAADVYPGHGPKTVMGEERKNNRYIQ